MNAPMHIAAEQATRHTDSDPDSPVHRRAKSQTVIPANEARTEDSGDDRADAIGAALMILGIAGMMLLWVSSR